MSSSRQGETKLQKCVITGMVSSENHSINGHGEVIRDHCYCDWACLAATECSNERADDIGLLLL
jgi:hypothetical protein